MSRLVYSGIRQIHFINKLVVCVGVCVCVLGCSLEKDIPTKKGPGYL